MSKTIRVGVVGCARILPAHLRGLKVLRDQGYDNFRITALCARKIEDAQMFRKRGEGPTPRLPPTTKLVNDPLNAPHMYVSDVHSDVLPELYTDWREMLAADNVDAVLNLTPHNLHHTVTLDSFRAGKHVLIEKPFAITVRAGQRMVDAARESGLVLGVAEVVRYFEATRVQKWLIESGQIGRLQMWISGGVGGGDWPPDNIVAKTPWRHRKLEAGGGPAVDGGVHMFSRIRYLCGEIDEIGALAPTIEPRRYTRDESGAVIDTVEAEVEDAFFAQLRLVNGAVGTAFGGAVGHGGPTGITGGTAIYGSLGCLIGDEILRDGGEHAKAKDLFDRDTSPELAKLKEEWFPRGIYDGFALQHLDFYQAIETGGRTEIDGADGLRDLACSYALLESATLNHPVKVADVLAGKVDTYQRPIDKYYGLVDA